jgi:hypothetical protein
MFGSCALVVAYIQHLIRLYIEELFQDSFLSNCEVLAPHLLQLSGLNFCVV